MLDSIVHTANDGEPLRRVYRPALFVVQNECAGRTPRETICEPECLTAQIIARLERDAGSRWSEICQLFSSVTFAVLPRFGRTIGPADARYKSTDAGLDGLRALQRIMCALPDTRQNYYGWLEATRHAVEARKSASTAE